MVYVGFVLGGIAFVLDVITVVCIYKANHSSTRKYLKRIQKMGRAYLETRRYEGE
jgi:hypothetical protein